jgi:ketosteroid isomerase-like protein
MSQENVELIDGAYQAWNSGDRERGFELFDPHIEWQLPEGGINAGTSRGHDAVRALVESYLDAFDYFQMEPERFFEAGDRVVVFLAARGRGKGSGAEVEVHPAHVWTMRAGKAVRVQVFPYASRAEALGSRGAIGEGRASRLLLKHVVAVPSREQGQGAGP